MTRVAVTVEQFWHKVPGGTGSATAQTLRSLSGESVSGESSYNYVGVAARHSPADTPHLVPPIPVLFSRWPRPALYEAWLRSGLASIESIVGEADLVWASAMVVPPAAAPTVVTVHDLDFLDHPEWLSSRGRGFFPRAWRVATERAVLMVCPSQTVANSCETHGVEAERIRVVPWGVDSQRVTAEHAGQVRIRFGLPERYAVWVGTLEPRKNLERVVAAVGQVEGLHLAVVGPDGWNVDHETVIAPLGARAHKLGRVSQNDLAGLYAAASVFVFPSLAEGFGLPVLEAMAQGTPVVTSAGTGTADAAQGAASLVKSESVDEIAEAIRVIVADPVVAQSMSESALAVAAASTWAKTAKGYHEVFSEVLQ